MKFKVKTNIEKTSLLSCSAMVKFVSNLLYSEENVDIQKKVSILQHQPLTTIFFLKQGYTLELEIKLECFYLVPASTELGV